MIVDGNTVDTKTISVVYPVSASINFRGTFSTSNTYYGTAGRRDVVYYVYGDNKAYYISKASAGGSFTTSSSPLSDTNH